MQRILIVVLAVLVMVGCAIAYVFYTQSGVSSVQNQPNSQVTTTPAQLNIPPSTNDANGSSKSAVQAAYQIATAAYNEKGVQLYNTVIADGFAVQVWQGTITSGEALLKYLPNKEKWMLLTNNGGVWTLQGLVEEGVPTSTAQTLLANVKL